MSNENQQERTNLVENKEDKTLIVNIDQLNNDIKWDTSFRNKLKNEIGNFTDAYEDVSNYLKKLFSDKAMLPVADFQKE